MGEHARISLICSTIGRPRAIRELLDSVARSDVAEAVEFVLVDQSPDRSCIAVLDEVDMPGPKISTVTGRGLSIGRNRGIALSTAPILAFPDDNCLFPTDTIGRALDVLVDRPDLAGISGTQATAAGTPSMLRWPDEPTLITRRNFFRTSISSTLFLRRSALPSDGPFDEGIGAGSVGWRGAGEESDLLLRLIASGHQVLYRPDIVVNQEDDRDAITDEYVTKMLKYGVGMGHLWRRHRLSRAQLGYLAARKLAGCGMRTVRGRTIEARADIAYLRGQWAGYRGTDPKAP
ncbi:glycosyl transferase [Mycobacterium antarcticum]|uniref:glycosyltransferase family 2 protein n=1 Tax=unclassified Mycolicibacterium TaxID=2636767 RepID=UPI002388FDA8|nr:MULTISPECIES: glycosyltransferase family A protein [unclassified Mycolicibacterium]GLP77702.1 glycosyl transferase [Mycolicibacterium sp. TUM20983]GLP81898.1 glycosyl transferase [Mycolicibacterium sp. TUM20984]